jgi:hypothetical protein
MCFVCFRSRWQQRTKKHCVGDRVFQNKFTSRKKDLVVRVQRSYKAEISDIPSLLNQTVLIRRYNTETRTYGQHSYRYFLHKMFSTTIYGCIVLNKPIHSSSATMFFLYFVPAFFPFPLYLPLSLSFQNTKIR